MIEIKIQCDSWDEVRLYSNAVQYHHLLQDFLNAMRSAQKHGTEADVTKVLDEFLPDMYQALENHEGAY